MLKAASLAYAIFITLIIAILCYSVLLVFSLNNNLENYFDLRKKLLMHNQSAIAVIRANYSNIEELNSFRLFPEDGDITTTVKMSPWGAFKQAQIITHLKKDTVQQGYLFANAHHKNSPALYLRDNDENFKIAGNTYIQGDIYISNKGLKKVTITGHQSGNKPIHNGKINTSEKNLPNISTIRLIYPQDFIYIEAEDIKSHSIINGFDQKTKVIKIGAVLENIKLKGNIIVQSNDTIQVLNTAILEDIIIEAPKVVFHSGFKGSLQVFASNEVVLDPGVVLDYPSVLIIESDFDNKDNTIVFKENSQMNGMVVLYGEGLKTESKNNVIIEAGSTVTGSIYCDGKLSLYGSVKGTVVASALEHKTHTTNHSNLILDASIFSDSIPRPYFNFQPLEKYKTTYPIILKQL